MHNPLGSAFSQLLEYLSNAVLDLDLAAKSKLERLEGRCIQICAEGMVYSLLVSQQKIHLYYSEDFDWDVRLKGDFLSLSKLLLGNRSTTGVQIDGDELLLSELLAIFGSVKPDIESPLAAILGEAPAQSISGMLQLGLAAGQMLGRGIMQAGVSKMDTHAQENYLQRDEFDIFLDELYELQLSVDRLNQQLIACENQLLKNTDPGALL